MTGAAAGGAEQGSVELCERVLEAVFDLVLENGYRETTAKEVCARAGVSLDSFSERFQDVQTCVGVIYDEINVGFDELTSAAYEAHPRWRDGLRAAAYAAADWFAGHPREVRFCTVAILDAGEMIAVKRDAYLRRFVDMIDAGRAELPDPDAVGRGAAESALGGIFESLLRAASQGGDVSRARDMVPELMYLAVRPYVGHAEAMKEFSIPPPCVGGSSF